MRVKRSIYSVLLGLCCAVLCQAANTAIASQWPPLPEALDAMVSDDNATVETVIVPEWEADSNYYYAFEPTAPLGPYGIIIYPGAFVDPRAYAPMAHAIAAQGYWAVIVKMVGDIAFYNNSYRRANKIISDYSDNVTTWAIAGHSLGGPGACAYVNEFPSTIDAVIMWASYPSENYPINKSGKKGLSIYGTNDGLTTLDEIATSHAHMPLYTRWVAITGGNHTQFGSYDVSPYPVQPEDNPAGITRQEQQDQIVAASVQILEDYRLCTNDPEGDVDNDNVCGDVDNCPYIGNGPGMGTCVKTTGGVIVGTGVPCTDNATCGSGQTCQMNQGNINGNSLGDACECYADCNHDGKVNTTDLGIMKVEFFRTNCATVPCQADANGDNKVNTSDLGIMKVQFFKTGCPVP